MSFTEKLQKVEYLTTKLRFRSTYLDKMYETITINETYNSNRIEGNTLTLGDTFALLNNQLEDLKIHTDRDRQEILVYKMCLEQIVTDLKTGIHVDMEYIEYLHYLLFKDTKPEWADYMRQGYGDEVGINNSTVKLIEGQNVLDFLNNTLDWYHNTEEVPVLKIALFKLDYTHCHLFFDGNGRTSRLLMNLMLMQHGYYPFTIREGTLRA